jgi:hypothetical protein
MHVARFSPGADPGRFAGTVAALGMLAALAWLVWRFGPTLLRIAGFCSLWIAWACGSQGGYGYCAAFLVLGTLAWGGGTVWYATRRGRWPSALSGRLLTRVLGKCRALGLTESRAVAIVPRRHK